MNLDEGLPPSWMIRTISTNNGGRPRRLNFVTAWSWEILSKTLEKSSREKTAWTCLKVSSNISKYQRIYLKHGTLWVNQCYHNFAISVTHDLLCAKLRTLIPEELYTICYWMFRSNHPMTMEQHRCCRRDASLIHFHKWDEPHDHHRAVPTYRRKCGGPVVFPQYIHIRSKCMYDSDCQTFSKTVICLHNEFVIVKL